MVSAIGHGVLFLRTLLGDFLDFIYPPFCGICGHRLRGEEKNICQNCWRSLTTIEEPFCQRCGLPLDSAGPVCSICQTRQHLFSFARALGPFDKHYQRIIHLFKYRHRRSLAEPLAEVLASMVRRDRRFAAMEAIVPIPLHPAKARARGYNQSELMAARLARKTGLKLENDLLLRVKNTSSQSGLGLVERNRNVRDAFRVKDPQAISAKRLILLDDVLTTGATADACTEALLRAGVEEVCVLTVARTPEPGVSG
jgi:competence protein ComFC